MDEATTRRGTMERREIQRFHDLEDPLEWTFADEHGHELFHRGEGESAQEMEAAGYREFFPDRFIDEIWIAEEHAGCGGRRVFAVKQ
jgi:hypothetical protein